MIGSIGLSELVAGIMVLALNAYVLMGGADFGGGVWDLLASGPRRERQRALIANSIAPIWEANHVWLIIVVVMLFTAFPVAFGVLSTVLHLPLTLMLLGIVMRGSAFVFRSYGSKDHTTRHRWGAAFASASVITPIVLGMIVGAVASGRVGVAAARVDGGSFAEVYVAPWLGAFPLAVGFFALSLFALLAAVYLTIEARDDELRADFRARALGAAGAVFVFAMLALVLAQGSAPRVAGGVTGSAWSWPLHVSTGTSAIAALWALWTRRYRAARVAAAAQVSFILWGWALSQFPYIVPETLTIRAAAAPTITLELLLGGLAVGALVLIPSLRYLFKTFAGKATTLSS
jgi:cytochrome bd ubiquinol oxidase subunit II